MIMMQLFLFFVLALFSAKAAYDDQNTYRAAVLEYNPAENRSAPFEIWQKNINTLTSFIQDAATQGAQIVVFPEYGLTGIDIDPKHLDILSTEIPDFNQNASPCTAYNVKFSQLQKPSSPYHSMAEDPIVNGTITDDLTQYTFKSLKLLRKQRVVETICSGSSSFCCTFDISTNRIRNAQLTYVYKLAAFQGNWRAQEKETIGQRICGIVACLSEDLKTCGARKAVISTGITFEKISIKTTVDATDARYMPITLTSDLKPTANYTFCSIKNGNKIDITMSTTQPHATLFTFGISGRIFKYDGLS